MAEKTTPEAPAFAAKYRDNPGAIAKYLNDALSTGDLAIITKAIGDLVRAQGVSSFARKTGIRRNNVYKMLSGERNPGFGTVINVLNKGTLCAPTSANRALAITSPSFEAPNGRYDWLNSGAYVGTLELVSGVSNTIRIRFYQVR